MVKCVHFLAVLGVILGGLVLTTRADEKPQIQAPVFELEAGTAYDVTAHRLLASSTFTLVRVYQGIIDLRIGSLFDDTTTLWAAGVSVDLKTLANQTGAIWQPVWDVDLGFFPAIDLRTGVVHYSVNATLLKVRW